MDTLRPVILFLTMKISSSDGKSGKREIIVESDDEEGKARQPGEPIGDTKEVIPRDRSRLGGRREPGNGSAVVLLRFKVSLPLLLSCPASPPLLSSPLLPSLPSPFLFVPIFSALLLRVPSFPRILPQCLPILAWIRTGRPGTSTVSMPKSWLWVIAVSLLCPASSITPPLITVATAVAPLSRRWQDQPVTTIHSK